MRITVFGATGRTGRYILAEGLRRDHQLTAFTRWPAALVGPSTLAAVAWTTAAICIQSARQSTVRTR